MAEKLVAKYTKPGAVFATADEAQADRKAQFSPELSAQIANTYATLQSTGIIISGPVVTWDQANVTLTIERVVSSNAEYANFYATNNNNSRQAIESAEAATGWTRISFDVVPV